MKLRAKEEHASPQLEMRVLGVALQQNLDVQHERAWAVLASMTETPQNLRCRGNDEALVCCAHNSIDQGDERAKHGSSLPIF